MEILNNKKYIIFGGIIVIVIIAAIIVGIFILNNSNKDEYTNTNTNEILNIEQNEEKIEQNNIYSKIYVHIVGEVVQQRSN